KLRGAFTAISALPAAQRERGVVAHSSGNHGLAVAYAAAALGVPAAVVVPDNAAEVKVAAAARHGARIVTVEPTLAARIAGTQELIDRYGYALIRRSTTATGSRARAQSAWRSRPTARTPTWGWSRSAGAA